MYTRFWGFREKPFRQVPNPDFLFLSATHEEALAHLNYAVAEGEGFLMIAGEVGTGKSTLCRSFLQKLDPDVACAYIFNSKLEPLQLLKSINTEFGIPADAATSQDLIDILNAFLIDKRASGHRVVIVIDEAQNLPVESLEQVRLLSNLETTREKLLQLVLVGQPELAEAIDSFELRQLGQRIHLACHLRPLSFDETVQYIQHRINLVSQKPQMPFEKGALRAVYAFSKGVPRLVNTACDRMLLAAYLKNRSRISARMATQMIEELHSRGRPRKPVVSWVKVAIPVSVAIVSVIAVLFFLYNGQVANFLSKVQQQKKPVSASPAEPQAFKVATEPAAAAAQEIDLTEQDKKLETDAAEGNTPFVETAMPLDAFVRSIQHEDTRRSALEAVLRQWGLEPQGDMVLADLEDAAYFDLIAERHGLSIQTIEHGIDALVVLDLPAVITLKSSERDQPVYVGMVGVGDSHFELTVLGHDAHARTDALTLMRLWGGKAVVPWKNYMGYPGVIPGGAPRAAVVLLKQLLWEIGYSELVIDDRYDDMTRLAVREIQARHGLAVDGLVGNMTKIVLFNEKQSLPIPHLSKWLPDDNRTD